MKSLRFLLLIGVLLVLSTSLFAQTDEIIATVNDDIITISQFREAVRMQRIIDSTSILRSATSIVELGYAATLSEAVNFLYQADVYFRQIVDENTRSPEQAAQRTLDTQIDALLIREEAERLEIVVTDEDIDAQIEAFFAFDAESSDADQFQADLDIFYNRMNVDVRVSRERVRQYFADLALQQKIGEFLTADKETTIWANTAHILVETETESQEIYDALQNGGDFAQLAQEFSLDTSNSSNGGEIGWVNLELNLLVEPYNTVALTTPVGEYSEPFETEFGWHILFVLEREDRPIMEQDRDEISTSAFEKWLDIARSEAIVDIVDDWQTHIPDEPVFELPQG
ncbi:MAG: peptidylprolyl isomerase [Anaerolineae bacterium]|nr:peptidylprolyl isomerase [Anaerolineae bacterium]